MNYNNIVERLYYEQVFLFRNYKYKMQQLSELCIAHGRAPFTSIDMFSKSELKTIQEQRVHGNQIYEGNL